MNAGVVERVKPGDLEVAANVRREVELTKEFVASVKQHGVLVPIIVQPGLDGYAVIDGQRRVLAAVEAGVDEVPVVVVDSIEKAQDRIVQQLVVNDHRAGLTQADEVAAVQELALFGMSATAIARKIGAPKKAVDVAIAVGSSEVASAAMRESQVTLAAAALIAEFDDDPEVQAELADHAVQGYNIEHRAQQHRDARARAVVEAEIEAMEGVTLVEPPSYDSSDPARATDLYLDEKLTEPVTEERLDELVGNGLCAFPTSSWEDGGRVWGIAYAVKGWREHGLHAPSWIANRGSSSKPSTPEEAAALKEERRQARENTKAWVSATAVRIGFLQELLQRKTLPAGWELLVAEHVVVHHYNGASSGQWKITATLLQVERVDGEYSDRQPIQRYLEANPTKAGHVALAAALGGVEGASEFDRKGWWYQDNRRDATRAYLAQLEAWGYEPAEVERGVLA
jgi:ParB family chromosome partitioning protein